LPSTTIDNPMPPAETAARADVLFVHIQKTAGMSLYNSLAQWFGADRSLRYPRSSQEFKDRFLALPDAEIDRLRLLSGHFDLPFWLQRNVGDRFVVSLVREPVERILSIYRYAKSWKQHRRHGDIGQMSVEAFVDDYERDTSRHNWQCRKLCGVADFHAAIAMAQKQIDLLGAVEMIDLLHAALGEQLGTRLDVRTDNRSQDPSPRRDDLEPALLSRLQAHNVEDYKLWAYVVERNLVRGHR